MLSVDELQLIVIDVEEDAVAETPVGTDGGAVSPVFADAFETFTLTDCEVALLPDSSLAIAVKKCCPFDTDAVFQTMEYGAEASSCPRFTPSNLN